MSKLPNCGIIKIKGINYCWEIKSYWRSQDPGNTDQGLGIHVFTERAKPNVLIVKILLEESLLQNQPSIHFLPYCIKPYIIQALQDGWEPLRASPNNYPSRLDQAFSPPKATGRRSPCPLAIPGSVRDVWNSLIDNTYANQPGSGISVQHLRTIDFCNVSRIQAVLSHSGLEWPMQSL